jgi:hypothetical protein
MTRKTEKKKMTTISLSFEIKERLNQCGHKGESYDEILTKLIDNFEKEQK